MESNQDLPLPILRNIVEAHKAISRMGEGWQKEAIQLMIIGVQGFYSEQPSLLAGDLDIAFLVEVLKDIQLRRPLRLAGFGLDVQIA